MIPFAVLVPVLAALIGVTVALTAQRPAVAGLGAAVSTSVFAGFAVVAAWFGLTEFVWLMAATAALNVLLGVGAVADARRAGADRS